MNTHPHATTLLCFGDSNTWGQKPDMTGRYAPDVRWTGQLQQLLGAEYAVIEEGLSSRTTDLDYPKKPGRNGRTYLLPCLASHNPLDIVVLMLGSNDLKTEFNRTPSQIAAAIGGLVKDIRDAAWNNQKEAPKILLVSPIFASGDAPYFWQRYGSKYDQTSIDKSHALAGEISNVARQLDCTFLDAAKYARAGEDGVHFDEASNGKLAKALGELIPTLA